MSFHFKFFLIPTLKEIIYNTINIFINIINKLYFYKKIFKKIKKFYADERLIKHKNWEMAIKNDLKVTWKDL